MDRLCLVTGKAKPDKIIANLLRHRAFLNKYFSFDMMHEGHAIFNLQNDVSSR